MQISLAGAAMTGSSRPETAHIAAGVRAFSLAFSITQCDVVPSAEPDADRRPCAVWLAKGRRWATSPSML